MAVEDLTGRGNRESKDGGLKACGMFRLGPGPVCMSEGDQWGDWPSEWVEDYGEECLHCRWFTGIISISPQWKERVREVRSLWEEVRDRWNQTQTLCD